MLSGQLMKCSARPVPVAGLRPHSASPSSLVGLRSPASWSNRIDIGGDSGGRANSAERPLTRDRALYHYNLKANYFQPLSWSKYWFIRPDFHLTKIKTQALQRAEISPEKKLDTRVNKKNPIKRMVIYTLPQKKSSRERHVFSTLWLGFR